MSIAVYKNEIFMQNLQYKLIIALESLRRNFCAQAKIKN